MGYIGKIPATQGKDAGPALKLDDISSNFNGTKTVFDLTVGSTAVDPHVNNIAIYLSGVYQIPGSAFSLSGSQVEFTAAPSSSLAFHGSIIGDSRIMTPDNNTIEPAALTTDTSTSVSGSWQGVVGSGSLGMVSGSAISTGSFGAVNIAGMTVPNLINVSSSVSSRVNLLEGSGSITESSASFSTRVALLEGSGSITESSASFSTRITSEEGNVDALQTDSGSFSTRVTTAEASGALFDGTGAVTFATVDTGQGANELYDMDQNVKTDSNVTFGNITATGTVTAEEFHTEFVSASIVYASGSTKFGDTSDDIHSFTGSIHLTNSGSVSGSSTSTASFGRVEASTVKGTLATAAQTNITSVGTIATGVWDSSFGSTANTTISGSWQGVIGSGSLGMVSGSAISTGSFGAVNIAGMTVPNLLDFSSSIASRVTSEESDFTAAGISGSWQGVIGSGSLGMVSGSAISTGSFASLRVTSPQTLTIDNKGTVSGSIYSTGSFGKLIGEGGALSNVTAVPFLKTGSYYSATTDVKITGSLAVSGNISGSYSGLSVGQKYLHAQSSAATTWTISHNFDYQFVNVDVYDSNDQIVIPTSITATDTNTITLTFGSAISGNAIISTGGQARDELGKNKQHIQDTAATNWRVTHSVGEQYPSVTVYDEEDNVIQPQQIYAASAQRMDIVFAQPQSGNANFSVGGGISLSSITSSVQLSGVNFGDISGSVTSTGSFGALRVVGPTLKVDNVGTVSGSATSTGSFGAVSVAGMTVSNLLDFSSSIASRVTTEESDFTAAGISGSWQGVVGSGSLGMVSGSAISTGSFGYVNVAGMTTPSILALSSSIETRLNSLSADIIALSIALG